MTTTHQATENLAAAAGTFRLGGDLPVVRLGYGTMQLPGEGVWGPPKDKATIPMNGSSDTKSAMPWRRTRTTRLPPGKG